MVKEVALKPLFENAFKSPRGRKPVYLPNFQLTLLRTPYLPPRFASFIVPLNFNKLDMKDYLYHAYNIPVLAVRSFIQQQRVRQDKPSARFPRPRRWYRPRAIKKMTVEMATVEDAEKGLIGGPFVWPPEETDLEPWDKSAFDAAEKAREEENERHGTQGDMLPAKDRKSVAAQAKALLEGREKWRSSWVDFGLPREVEVDINVDPTQR